MVKQAAVIAEPEVVVLEEPSSHMYRLALAVLYNINIAIAVSVINYYTIRNLSLGADPAGVLGLTSLAFQPISTVSNEKMAEIPIEYIMLVFKYHSITHLIL